MRHIYLLPAEVSLKAGVAAFVFPSGWSCVHIITPSLPEGRGYPLPPTLPIP